jgi:hypothetical protein
MVFFNLRSSTVNCGDFFVYAGCEYYNVFAPGLLLPHNERVSEEASQRRGEEVMGTEGTKELL